MTRTPPHGTVLPTLLAAVLSGAALTIAPLVARGSENGDLDLLRPRVPPTPPGVSSAAGYVVIVNGGTEDERLLGGSVPFADGVELHRTTVEDEVARMRRLDDGLAIPAGATVRLEPGGTHLMFIGLAEPLADGERRPVTLRFERAGEIDVAFAVERPEPSGAAGDAVDQGTTDHGTTGHESTDHGETPDDTMSGGAGGTNHGGTPDAR